MPKTHGYLFQNIYDFDTLLEAHQKASKRKRGKLEVQKFETMREDNLITLQNELIWHTWKPLPPREFQVFEPKRREISAPQYRDRVVHHALCTVIEPLFERKMIARSYACRKGKGTHRAAMQAQLYARELGGKGKFYCLKCDIRKYFSNIDHDILKKILRRTIRDREVLWLVDEIIDQGAPGGCGVPIGALTSQLFANVYLDQLDHLIKDELGINRYIRYMDDFVIFSNDKDELRVLLHSLRHWLKRHLKLELNAKTRIITASEGLDFCGYRIWPGYRLPRKRNVRRIRKRLRKMAKMCIAGKINPVALAQVWASFCGYAKHCSCYKTTTAIQGELNNILMKVGDKK